MKIRIQNQSDLMVLEMAFNAIRNQVIDHLSVYYNHQILYCDGMQSMSLIERENVIHEFKYHTQLKMGA